MRGRRVEKEEEEMNRRPILAVGAAAIALAVVGIYLVLAGGPGEQGSTHASERHGYTLRLPDETWWVIERPGAWELGATFNEDGPGTDHVRLRGAPNPIVITLNTQAVPDEMTFDDWFEAYDEANRRAFARWSRESSGAGEMAGAVARFTKYVSTAGANALEVNAFHAGRAYSLRVWGPTAPDWDPRPVADEWLARFSFSE
jgi:hypothetical protein